MALPDLTELHVADTYKGVLHTSNVPILGANLPPVYDGLGNKSSLRLGSNGNGASFSGTLSADGYHGLPEIDFQDTFQKMIDFIYPVGAVYFNTLDGNPQTRFVGTTWIQISQGKFLAGIGGGVDKNLKKQELSAGDDVSIGEYRHTLTDEEIATHSHQGYTMVRGVNGEILDDEWPESFIGRSVVFHENKGHTGATITANTPGRLDGAVFFDEYPGGDQPHNNIPPYFGMYVWKRIA